MIFGVQYSAVQYSTVVPVPPVPGSGPPVLLLLSLLLFPFLTLGARRKKGWESLPSIKLCQMVGLQNTELQKHGTVLHSCNKERGRKSERERGSGGEIEGDGSALDYFPVLYSPNTPNFDLQEMSLDYKKSECHKQAQRMRCTVLESAS